MCLEDKHCHCMHLAYDGSVELTMVTKQQPGVEVKLTLRLRAQDRIRLCARLVSMPRLIKQ